MKEFKTIEQQIGLLKSRKLIIGDEILARKRLLDDNYYNIINGYKDPFLLRRDEEEYITGSTFEEIYALYDFDRKIKNIFLDNILLVENALRSQVAYYFSEKYGNDNYLRIENFETLRGSGCSDMRLQKRVQDIQNLICSLQNDISSGICKKLYVRHYMTKYGFVPLWVLVNAISFGRLVQLYSLISQDLRVKVSKNWNIKEDTLRALVKNMAYYRNLCAHGERIYDAKSNFLIPDTDYHMENRSNIVVENHKGKDDILSLIISLKILLDKENYDILEHRLNVAMRKLAESITSIDVGKIYEKMGFPKGAREIHLD